MAVQPVLFTGSNLVPKSQCHCRQETVELGLLVVGSDRNLLYAIPTSGDNMPSNLDQPTEIPPDVEQFGSRPFEVELKIFIYIVSQDEAWFNSWHCRA
ncbi:hypothetical protein ACHWQZ_G011371 [Mnemiopsis leidyi]